MRIEEVKKAFSTCDDAKKYRSALKRARRLSGNSQLKVLDDMFAAADRLKLQRGTGEPLGMEQLVDGSVTVTWQEVTNRPDGSSVRTISSAILEPTDFGNGWRSRTKDVPEEVVEAVTAAAMNDELKPSALAKKKRRVYVR